MQVSFRAFGTLLSQINETQKHNPCFKQENPLIYTFIILSFVT